MAADSTTDPYKEFELYLEKAHEEIGAVFHRLEAREKSERILNPPVPPIRRYLPPVRRRVTEEDYFIGDLEAPPQRFYHHWSDGSSSGFRRRISCPGLNNNNNLINNNVILMDNGPPPSIEKKKKIPAASGIRNPRRYLRRYLTADSALKLSHHHQETDNNLWTSELMAEFNHVIDGELIRLRDEPISSLDRPGRELSPWAKVQLSQLASEPNKTAVSIEQISADIDSVQRQILDDLDVLNATLNHRHQSEEDEEEEEDEDSQLSSPILRPQELQDFLRRVEDSIRTDEPEENLPTATVVEVIEPEGEPIPAVTDRDAGTQTSPMSLSRSSSFLWVSDCNCSGSLDGSALLLPAGTGGATSPGDNPASSGVSRIVHMDTSATSSLVSLNSNSGGNRRRYKRMCTPDSAADAEDDEDEGSSVSLARSTGGGGAESGIGTGSPRPKDRRKNKVAVTQECQTQDQDSSSSSSSSSSSTSSGSETMKKKKNRDKVRRRETWEKIRRRHSCKRINSRRKDKTEVVWIRRTDAPSPTPPPVPPHAVPVIDPATTPVVLHKPPLVTVSSSPILSNPRPKPRPLHLDSPTDNSSVRIALQSVLAMELLGSSTPSFKVKPISASSTPTDPHITLEAGLTAARSHSESAFAELEATEACRWLRATGFPQYAQMYEDWQFPLDLKVVERDHPFLDVDSLQALFRRLSTLNRMAKIRSEKAAAGRHSQRLSSDNRLGRSDEEEDQECALSDQWTFQRHSRRWSRIVDLLPASLEAEQDAPEGAEGQQVEEGGSTSTVQQGSDEATSDPIILGSFRRSSSERLRHGAKSLLRRMESLRSKSRKRPPTRPDGSNGLVISAPQLVDAAAMEDRMRDRNYVDLSPTGSTPSPDINQAGGSLPGGGDSLSSSPFGTPSPAGSLKTPKSGGSLSRAFFGRRSFRPSTSSAGADHHRKDSSAAHSDSECSPSYSPTRRKMDANSNVPEVFSPSGETPPSRGRLYLNFNSKSSSKSSKMSPDVGEAHYLAETPTPSGSLREGERMLDALLGQDTASTGTGAEGDGAHSPSSGASGGIRAPLPVVRWHSFRRSSSTINDPDSNSCSSSIIPISSLPVGQFALLRKLALLRLTALLERHSSSSKPSWGWDLPKFMRKTKSPDYKDKSIFGVPLSVMMQRTGEALPHPILAALHYLRQSALDQVGLFRKSGVRSRITRLKDACEAWGAAEASSLPFSLDQPQDPMPEAVDFDQHQPYDVADMVKQYFRELPEALMTNKLSETFVTIFQVVPVGMRLDALRCAVLLLPDEHREALQTFLSFLTDVAALASVNQMTPSNLAVCLAPSLFHLPATLTSSSPSGGSGSGSTPASSNSPRRRKTVGIPDQRELSQNKAAHDCLLQMINDFRNLFTVPEDIFRQVRCTYLDDGVPVTLQDLRTAEFGDWQAYMNGCMAAMLKETKEKTRGWESMSNEWRIDVAWKKVGDGHALRLWRATTEVEAPPAELLHRILRERHLWDGSLVRQRTLVRLDKQSEVFAYSTASEVPPSNRDFVLLRSWRSDLPRGTCLVAETSIEHPEASSPVSIQGSVPCSRGIVLASRYLIQPCGAGKCRLVHLSRIDVKGRSPEWYNKNYGHLCAMHVARMRDSFRQHLVIAQGPESKV